MKKGLERKFVSFDPSIYAVEKTEMPVKVFFSEDEIEKKKAQHFEDSVKLDFAEQEKKEYIREKNQEIKKLKISAAKAMAEVKKGYREESQEVYLVPDFDSGIMEYITKSQEVVASRRLRPDEMQDTVLKIAK